MMFVMSLDRRHAEFNPEPVGDTNRLPAHAAATAAFLARLLELMVLDSGDEEGDIRDVTSGWVVRKSNELSHIRRVGVAVVSSAQIGCVYSRRRCPVKT